MRELWLRISQTSGAKVYSLATGILTLALTARTLGPEGRGAVASAMAWVGLFSTFFCLSLGQVTINRMAGDRGNSLFGVWLGSLLFFAVVLSVFGWVTAFSLYHYSAGAIFGGIESTVLMLAFVSLPFMIWEQYGSSLLMGLEQLKIYNLSQIIGRSISIFLIIVFVWLYDYGVCGVVASQVVGQILVALAGARYFYFLLKKLNLKLHVDYGECKSLVRGGSQLHLNSIGSYLVNSTNILILSYYHGAGATGHFQLVQQMIAMLLILPQAASMVLYGKIASLGADGAWPINKVLLVQISLLMLGLSLFTSLAAPWGITLLAGEQFEQSVAPLQWMVWGLVGQSFSVIMAPQWIGRGYFIHAASLTFVIGVVNLTANLWLIPLYGMFGAVYAYLFTCFTSIIFNGAMAWHCEKASKR